MLGDVSESATHDAAVAEAVRRWGRLDVYVNNAAIGGGGGVLDAKVSALEDGCTSYQYKIINKDGLKSGP